MSEKGNPDDDVATGEVVKAGTAPAGGSTDLALYDTALFPKLLDQDPAAVRMRFAERFKRAKTVDDLFEVLSGNTSKDLVGKVVTINGVSWAPYESDRGTIPLAVCDAAEHPDGEVFEFATTGDMLTMFIRQAELIGGLPFTARITSKKTRSGQTALNFERP